MYAHYYDCTKLDNSFVCTHYRHDKVYMNYEIIFKKKSINLRVNMAFMNIYCMKIWQYEVIIIFSMPMLVSLETY